MATFDPSPVRSRSKLYAHQERVATYLYERDSAFAVLRMGAGKTATTLTAIADLLAERHIRHALVLAPKRVAEFVWPAEAKAWAHTAPLHLRVLQGSPAARTGLLATVATRHVTVCGIDNAQWLCDALAQLPDEHPIFDLLVIDETSRFKDPTSKRGKALAKQAKRFRNRWGLTGTPRPNGLEDLWGPARLIAPDMFPGSFYGWRQRHFYPVDYHGYRWSPHAHAEGEIRERFSQYAITLGDGDMPELPEISIIVDEVPLPPDVQNDYRTMERALFMRRHTRTGAPSIDAIVASNAAVATGKLAQIANGFVYDTEPGAPTGKAVELHSEKRKWLEDLRDDLQGEPALVVYEYLHDLDVIREVFGEIPYLGAGASDAMTRDAVDGWNARRHPYIALHPASGGHGLNLQHGGSRMIWLSPTWSAEMWEQTLARLHRPGQAEHVMVHVCVCTGTVDEMKRWRVIDKLTEQEAFERYLRLSQSTVVA